jgi:hypothetical protein
VLSTTPFAATWPPLNVHRTPFASVIAAAGGTVVRSALSTGVGVGTGTGTGTGVGVGVGLLSSAEMRLARSANVASSCVTSAESAANMSVGGVLIGTRFPFSERGWGLPTTEA